QSIPNLFFAHLYITVISVALGVVIAFPIALLMMRFKRLYLPVVTAAGIIYTLPSIALFVLLIPVTGLNAPTIIIPLVAYTQIVLIRNIIAAIRAVDPGLVEVGRAMGMNGFQVQTRVVLPLALPVIVAGLRVATVTTIGIATLSFAIGVPTLGLIIFQGFVFSYRDEILGGALLVTAFAIGADLLLLALQRALARGQRVVATA
ncbi:MAG TPA: ABC transporter permease, partial [Ktedonobacterales bacterium]|nr:ABC transporter permease [Ktedonobacterales bacterium]